MKILALVIAVILATVAIDAALPPYVTSVTYCDGIRCQRNCQRQIIMPNQCYHDLATGRHVMFHYVLNPPSNVTCFRGYGFADNQCKTLDEVSRNSLACGSCTGHRVFDCSLTNAVLELNNCTRCQNCTSANRYPINKCLPAPNASSNGDHTHNHNVSNPLYARVNDLAPCGPLVVMTTYNSWFGCIGTSSNSKYDIGYPAKFCASGTSTSRMWNIHRVIPANKTTTTTTVPPSLTAIDVEEDMEMDEQQEEQNDIVDIRLPSFEDSQYDVRV